ncbi:MAG: NAD(P)H-dependent glycerol-3-phosphate dehydrogenase, partial [Spirulinaceae cyanobacterium]
MINAKKTLTVLGKGVWGTALGTLASRNNHQVHLWSRSNEVNLSEALAAEVIVSAVSMAGVLPTIERVAASNLPENTIIVTATKGLDFATTLTPSQIWQAAFPNHTVAVLSGPNLSKEIQKGLPAATVVASSNLEAAKTVQQLYSSENFRVYINDDPLGTELGGTLKNVMAIAAGVCDGLELGTNAKSGLLTRALPEMIRVGSQLGAKVETFFGLSGLGDLLATCNSPLSRNYQVGYRLGKGQTLKQILEDLEGTAEGVNTTQVLIKIAKQEQLSVPIAQQVDQLLKSKTTPQEAVQALMERRLKVEN